MGRVAETIRPHTAPPHWKILMCAERAGASHTPTIPAAAGEPAMITSSAGRAARLNFIGPIFHKQTYAP